MPLETVGYEDLGGEADVGRYVATQGLVRTRPTGHSCPFCGTELVEVEPVGLATIGRVVATHSTTRGLAVVIPTDTHRVLACARKRGGCWVGFTTLKGGPGW